MWTTTQDYEQSILPRVYLDAMKKIQLKYGKDDKLVLIYPNPECAKLQDVAESDSNFHSLVTALVSKLDVTAMYRASLAHMNSFCDVLVDQFCQSGLVGKLQRFIRNIIVACETFGWFVFKEDVKEALLPSVPKDYLIFFMPRLEKYVAYSVGAKLEELQLGFVTRPGRRLQPQSTTKVMLSSFERMHQLRELHLEAAACSSKPCYIATHMGIKGNQNGAKDEVQLDKKIVNQSETNDVLERMVYQHVTSVHSSDQQEKANITHNLDGFVAAMGRENLKVNRQVEKLKVENLQKQHLIDLNLNGSKVFNPQVAFLPEGMAVCSSHLAVEPINICELERHYQNEWLAACTGTLRQRETRRQPEEIKDVVAEKDKFYRNLIIHEILGPWSFKTGIHFATECGMQ